MQNKRILVKFNFIHLSLVLLVLIILFLINLLAVRKLLLQEVEKGLSIKGHYLYNQLNASRLGVETSANNFIGLVKGFGNTENLHNYFDRAMPNNPLVECFCIIHCDKDGYKLDYHYSKMNIDSAANSIIEENMMVFYYSGMNQNWINVFDNKLKNYRFYFFGRVNQNDVMVIAYSILGKRTGIQMVSESGFPAIFNNNDEIIFHPLLNTPYQSLIETLPQRVKQQIPTKYKRSDKINLPGGIILQNLKPYADKEKYLTFLIYDENLQWYITMNQPYSALYKDLYVYFKQTGWWFLFMVVILLAAMVFINWTQLKPAIEIANQLKESPHLERRFLPEGNELTVIRKGFDLLQNQLNQYIKSFEKNAIDRSKLERDLQVAKKLQRSVLPAGNLPVNNHPNIEIFAVSESAFDIGGDLYDYFMIDDEHLLFVVGDVAGKGIPASLFMIFTHTLLRSVAKQGMSTNEIVATLNDKLIEENISDLFVTLFLGIVNINSGSFSFCNAAHCAPFLIHGKGELEELAETHGIPIGIYAKREYKQSTINLLPNDMMFVYTDGVVDAKDENGMNFSNEVLRFNLMGTWFKSCEDTVNKIKESVDSFRGNVNPEDDITLLALKFKSPNPE